ncbi:MAG: DEAD/DEAH box helicase [Planctomycetes bacterium]|nr:DEAD/DEAH box helicase [Planctomycetota bacterium]
MTKPRTERHAKSAPTAPQEHLEADGVQTPAEAATPAPIAGFAALGLSADLVETLAELGYEEPTPIQAASIQNLVAGRDLLGQAATGTGKTAAFALPLLVRVAGGFAERGAPRGLVLVPTRELAMQVAEAIHKYGKRMKTSVLPIYGGQSIVQQLRVLERGVEVVVATPGRALDHLRRGTLKLHDVRMVVLDEADEMLDMGFAEDLEALLDALPEKHQTALFSATMPARILGLAKRHLDDPVRVEISRERTEPGAMPRVRQIAYVVQRAAKPAALGRVLDMESPTSAIVFCRTRLEVDELTEAMHAHGYRAEALHGGFQQSQRDRVMKLFRAEKLDLLIATDVAARGLDIDHVSHVVNYDVPTDPDAYVHRIGRTGRAGREGVAITLLEPRERRLLDNIQRATRRKVQLATLPTIADLRARRLELTKSSVREALLAGELDPYRNLANELASESDALDVAAAAIKLVHQASHGENPADDAADAEELDARLGAGRPAEFGEPRFERNRRDDRGARPARGKRRDEHERSDADEGGRAARNFGSARLFVGAGRMDSLRPGDLVGAIANEAGVPGHAIGAIEIAERHSLVEVPEEAAEEVIRALRRTKIRGRKVNVRRDAFA